jgi:membrane protease YdiL (CAAX protease family)
LLEDWLLEERCNVSAAENRKQISTFLVLTLAFSSIFYFLIIKSGHLGAARGSYVVCLMWSPAVAAMLTRKIYGQPLSTLGWKWGNPRYQLMSYFIPLLYATIAYVGVWVFHLGGFYDHQFLSSASASFALGPLPAWAAMTLYLLFAATAGMVGSCSTALGEEIGWRGFLVPQLAKTNSFTATAFISGIIWSLWHYPILIFADYNSGTPTWYALTCFTVMVVSISFVFTWLRLKSGSLWTGVLLHASHNLFIQGFFDPITTDTGRTKYIIGEFGTALPLVCIAFAIYFWTKRRQLPAAESVDPVQSAIPEPVTVSHT